VMGVLIFVLKTYEHDLLPGFERFTEVLWTRLQPPHSSSALRLRCANTIFHGTMILVVLLCCTLLLPVGSLLPLVCWLRDKFIGDENIQALMKRIKKAEAEILEVKKRIPDLQAKVHEASAPMWVAYAEWQAVYIRWWRYQDMNGRRDENGEADTYQLLRAKEQCHREKQAAFFQVAMELRVAECDVAYWTAIKTSTEYWLHGTEQAAFMAETAVESVPQSLLQTAATVIYSHTQDAITALSVLSLGFSLCSIAGTTYIICNSVVSEVFYVKVACNWYDLLTLFYCVAAAFDARRVDIGVIQLPFLTRPVDQLAAFWCGRLAVEMSFLIVAWTFFALAAFCFFATSNLTLFRINLDEWTTKGKVLVRTILTCCLGVLFLIAWFIITLIVILPTLLLSNFFRMALLSVALLTFESILTDEELNHLITSMRFIYVSSDSEERFNVVQAVLDGDRGYDSDYKREYHGTTWKGRLGKRFRRRCWKFIRAFVTTKDCAKCAVELIVGMMGYLPHKVADVVKDHPILEHIAKETNAAYEGKGKEIQALGEAGCAGIFVIIFVWLPIQVIGIIAFLLGVLCFVFWILMFFTGVIASILFPLLSFGHAILLEMEGIRPLAPFQGVLMIAIVVFAVGILYYFPIILRFYIIGIKCRSSSATSSSANDLLNLYEEMYDEVFSQHAADGCLQEPFPLQASLHSCTERCCSWTSKGLDYEELPQVQAMEHEEELPSQDQAREHEEDLPCQDQARESERG